MTKEEFELLVQPGDYIRVQAGQETMEGTVKAVLSSSVLLLRRDGGRSVVEIASVSGLELDLEQPQSAPEAQPEPRNDAHSEPQPQQPAMPPAEECGQLAARAAAQGDFDRAEQLYQQALEQDRSAETLTRVFQTVYLSRKGTPEEQVARARRGLELLERRGDVLPEAARVNFRIHLLDDAGETQRYKEELEKAMPVVPQKQRVAYMNLLGKQLFGEGDYAGAARYFQMWRDTWLQERQPDQDSYTTAELKRDLNLVECYMHMDGHEKQAMELVESVLQLRPNSVRAKDLLSRLQGVKPERPQEDDVWQKGRIARLDFSQKRDYAGEHDFVNLFGFIQGQSDREWYYFQLGWVADEALRRELACACQARRGWPVQFIPVTQPDGKKVAREIYLQPGTELQGAEMLPVYTGTLVQYDGKKQELAVRGADLTEYTVKINNVVDPALYHYLKRTPQPGGVALRYTLSPTRGTANPARPVRVWLEEQAHREWAEKLAGRRWLGRKDLPALEEYLAALDEGQQVCWGRTPDYEPMPDAPRPPEQPEEKVVLPPRVRPFDLGNEAVQNKDYKAAENYFHQAIQQNDRRGKAVSSLITYIYLRIKRSDPDARQRMEEGLQLLEQYGQELGDDALSSMRTQLVEKLGDRERFEEELRRALTVSYRPTLRMNCHWRLSGILIQRGEYAQAAEHLEQWLNVRDSNAAVLGIEPGNLGKYAAISRMVEQKLAICCYQLPSRQEQARTLARKLLENGGEDEVARQILDGTLTVTRAPEEDTLEDIILQEEELLPPYALHLLDSTPMILFREGELQGKMAEGQYVATPEQAKQDIDTLCMKVKRSGGGENEAQYRVDIWCTMAHMTQQTLQRWSGKGERLRRNFIDADHVREKMGHALLDKADAMLQSQDTRLDTVRFLYCQSIPLCMARNPDRGAAFLRLVGTALLDAGERARTAQTFVRRESAWEWVRKAGGAQAARDLLLCTLSAPEQSAALRGELLGQVYENEALRTPMLEWMDAILGRAGGACAGREAFLARWEECWTAYDLFLKELEDCLQQCAQQMGSRVVLEEARRRLQQIHSRALLWETDRGRLEVFENKILDQLLVLLDRTSFAERRESYVEILAACDQMAQAIYRQPTQLSFHCLREVLESIIGRMSAQLNQLYRSNAPELSVGLVAENAYVNESGEVNLAIWVANEENRQMATIQEMEVSCTNDEVECWRMGAAVYRVRGGERSSSAWQFTLPEGQIAQGSFDVEVKLDYSYYSGYESGEQKQARDVFTGKLTVPLLGGAEFVDIENPYSRISGGNPLKEEMRSMFFGRDKDLQEIVDLLRKQQDGENKLTPQCVLVYGQKRTGKTSILNFLPGSVERACGKDAYMVVNLDNIGSLGTASGFLYRILTRLERAVRKMPELYQAMCEQKIMPLRTGVWKDMYARMSSVELDLGESQNCMITIFDEIYQVIQDVGGGEKYIPLFLIDEFTYLYQWLMEGKLDPRFLMFWKAFLEYDIGVVAVGMDSMPEFMAYSYPNMENCFASQKRKQVSYLLPEDARALAQDPIRLPDGSSRYQSEALEYLVELTAGSAFLMVILCDALVDYMNRKRIPRVSKTMIDLVVEELFHPAGHGRNSLEETHFEPQLADPGVFGEQAEKNMKRDMRRVLEWITIHCDDTAHEVLENRMLGDAALVAGLSEPERARLESLLERMVRREVLVKRPNRGVNYYKIKVDLLRRWLRYQMGV